MSTLSAQNYDSIRQVATSLPAIIAANFGSQVIAMQNHISSREDGNHFPDLQETNMLCKLINCMDKVKKYLTPAMTMQAIAGFIHFLMDEDPEAAYPLFDKLDEYIARPGNKGFKPSDLEYDVNPFTAQQPQSGDNSTSPGAVTPTSAATGGNASPLPKSSVFANSTIASPAANPTTAITSLRKFLATAYKKSKIDTTSTISGSPQFAYNFA